ncbi:DMT family transporter [Consotaella salsifontis]|uniref:EamA domain-containing membrane protein RarD n=1 Tax=Consotaella salsifontis TaxID=1365950 RepID=A0A1T4SRJ6_9HYPH|nr:DMT family transporter [Consotaella salsifontis]SKA30528.1 EamA domain-containing membrane protein RarD [Consotaella salsifontis]
MQFGVLLAFLAYFSFSCSDAAVKALGGSMTVFQIGFFTSLIALFPVLFAKRAGETWRELLVPRRPRLVLLRMVCGTSSGILGIYAFTHLPLAEAYALIFLIPFFVTVLSRLVLKEEIGWRRWIAVAIGLAGVLLVVRPGFNEILPAHFAALGVAAFGAITIIVLRVLGPSERRVTLMGSVIVAAIATNGALMIPTFSPPSLNVVPILVLGGLMSGIGQLLLVTAARLTPANRIAPTQYGQIVWATLLGAGLFGELPDFLAVVGMGLVGASGLFTFVREEKRAGWSRRTPVVRHRQ